MANKSSKRLGDFGVGTVHSSRPIGAIQQPRPGQQGIKPSAPKAQQKPAKKGK